MTAEVAPSAHEQRMRGQAHRFECEGPGHEPVAMASDDRFPPELVAMWLLQHAGHRMTSKGMTGVPDPATVPEA